MTYREGHLILIILCSSQDSQGEKRIFQSGGVNARRCSIAAAAPGDEGQSESDQRKVGGRGVGLITVAVSLTEI